MAARKPRNRAAQDATLINVRRLQRQVAGLARRVRALEAKGGKA